MSEDFLPPEDEEVPQNLQKKWDQEENHLPNPKPCPHCGELLASDAFSCLFCGERVLEKAGFLSRLIHFCFKSKWSVVFISLVTLSFLLLLLF